MTQRKVSEVLLRYTLDQSSLQRSLASNATFIKALNDTKASSLSLAATADRLDVAFANLNRQNSLEGIARGFFAAQKAGASTEDALIRVRTALTQIGARTTEIDAVAASITRLNSAAGGYGTRNLGRSISGIGTQLFMLPDVGLSTEVSRGLILAGRATETLNLSAGQLAIGLGVTGVAVGAFAFVLQAIQSQFEKTKKAAEDYVAAQEDTAKLISAGATSEDIQKRITGLNSERDALNETFVRLQQLQTNLQGAFDIPAVTAEENVVRNRLIAEASRELSAATGGQITNLDGLRIALEALDKQTITTKTAIGVLEGSLSTDAIKRNDAAALSIATQEREARALQGRIDRNIQYNQLIGRGSSDQVKQLIDEARIRKDVLQALVDSNKATQEQRDEIQNLTLWQDTLTKSVLPIIEARERETQALEDQLVVIQSSIAYNQQLAEQIRTSTVEQVEDRLYALQQEAEALRTFIPELEKLAPTSADAAQQLDEARLRLKQIGEDYADQMTRVLPQALLRAQQALQAEIDDILAQSGAKLAQIETERGEKEIAAKEGYDAAYTDAERKRGEALTDLAEKQAETRLKLERKSNTEIANSIYARNALATYLALQKRKEDLLDLEEDGKQRAGAIEKQFDEQKRVADKRYQEQLDDARDAAAKAVRIEQDKARAEISEKVRGYNAQIAALSTFTNQGARLVYDFANNALIALTHLVNQARQIAGMPGVISEPGVPGSPLPPVSGYQPQYPSGRPFAAGGRASGLVRVNDGGGMESALNYRSNQLMMLSEPMRIFNAPMTQRMLQGTGGGMTINIPIYGTQLTKRRIMEYAAEELGSTLDEKGWE